jgi:hypothetical protein
VLLTISLFWFGFVETGEDQGILWENRITGGRTYSIGRHTAWKSPLLYKRWVFPLSSIEGTFNLIDGDVQHTIRSSDGQPVTVSFTFHIAIDPELLLKSRNTLRKGTFENNLQKILSDAFAVFFNARSAEELYLTNQEDVSQELVEKISQLLALYGIKLQKSTLQWSFGRGATPWLTERVSSSSRRTFPDMSNKERKR